ncbi:hypothetical protein LTR10_009390 [Elasticomyces elasticus]|nr:hypothetical protein LTR10_009390 [Elasticomyces elasticus]KAK4971511.1 hypothetical protein LTR42_007239 [Elasticomyces elasticus]
MKSSLAATTILSAISMAAATINIGTVEYIDGATDNVAWVGGKSPCTFSVINGASSNPCGPHFETGNKESYYVSLHKSSGLFVGRLEWLLILGLL